ncbi:ribosome maturation factor RimP [Salinibacillus xinjiangensis]|uniref:Ribosome maturation factor RimP n=1 Tax=Salinibacillus xinjiangensis TaxID=1229268 RepID=A0A6G1X313_9BACI|nr:ribosome maturation factor RimP [Salinibacillus xinjiangensis]MRG85361.1 ribosome maturation factor RimP [Salinibacillus xinjiangensis]
MGKKVTELTEELVQPIVDNMGLELVDIEYVKEGKNWFLRVFVDKDGGVDIEECGKVSEQLSEKLDETEPIEDAYYLEVSSPGVERPLKKEKDFVNNVDKNVYVKLYQAIDGEKEFEGKLRSVEHNIVNLEVRVKTRTKNVEIPMDQIAKAHLAVTFD